MHDIAIKILKRNLFKINNINSDRPKHSDIYIWPEIVFGGEGGKGLRME